ncbi:MAG TPA: Smr/MutS family protein [Fibrobacteraceae bacterium]|nr:Smr/MutS family protein [Fibrobacteraceae bacterium]
MAFNEEEEMQLAWIQTHPMIDKDLEQKSTKRLTRTKRTNSKKIKKFLQDNPFGEPEQEIDLHGCEGLEAVEKVDSLIHAMIPAGYKVLRIIHGGGNLKYGNVKRFVDHHIKTRLKHLVAYYGLERNNPGSSLLKIKSDIEKAPLFKKPIEKKNFFS